MASENIKNVQKIEFQDHSGSESYAVFDSPGTLPQFLIFAMYVVGEDANSSKFDPIKLWEAINPVRVGVSHYRLEIHFLPGAKDDECIAHYRKEMEKRGPYTDQIDAVKKALSNKKEAERFKLPPREPSQRLPGYVPSYLPDHAIMNDELVYHSILFTISTQDFGPEPKAVKVRQVLFDRMTEEELEKQDPPAPEDLDLDSFPPVVEGTLATLDKKLYKIISAGFLNTAEVEEKVHKNGFMVLSP